jgi:hypothetical protein
MLLRLLLLLCLAPSTRATMFLLGPTTNLQIPDQIFKAGGVDSAEIVRQLLLLVDGEGVSAWNSTFTHVSGSGGALHARQQVLGFMSATQQSNYARAAKKLNLKLSIETGGAFCGAGSGAKHGQATLKSLGPFLEAGGHFSYLALESCFSRTHAGCKAQTQQATANEVAAFAATLAGGLGQPPPNFFLYDALPHMTVDKPAASGGGKWPRNIPNYDLDLGTLLRLLRAAMAKQQLELDGYWMDCPYEYSRDFPNATSPLPAGTGFQKVADAAALVKGMGLRVGKTFNSQQGGATSDQLFYASTLQDYLRTTKAVGGGSALRRFFDYAMVESWYPHPLHAAPETQEYTTTFTANTVFDHFQEDSRSSSSSSSSSRRPVPTLQFRTTMRAASGFGHDGDGCVTAEAALQSAPIVSKLAFDADKGRLRQSNPKLVRRRRRHAALTPLMGDSLLGLVLTW